MNLPRHRASLALLAMWLVFFAGAIFSTDVPYYRDHLVTNIPLRQYIRERLLAGELPQWFPYESLGVPVIGQIALGTFHPLNLLLTPLPAPLAEKWVVLLASLLGLIGGYRLAREASGTRVAALTAAAALAFGGFALGVSCIVAYVMSFAALPWVAWAALKLSRKQRPKDAAVLALCWSLVFFAGDALGFALAAVFAVIALVVYPQRRVALLLAAAGLAAALLVGIELIPATSVAAEAIRAVGTASPTMGRTWALHPLRIPELVAAGWVPDSVRGRVVNELLGGGTAMFTTTAFAGASTLALAAVGVDRKNRLAVSCLVLLVLSFVLALGERGGLLTLLQQGIDMLTRFRYPERYLAFFWVPLSVLVALGVDRAGAAWRPIAFGAGGALAIALALRLTDPATAAWSLVGSPLDDPALATTVRQAWSTGFLWAAVALAVLSAAVGRRAFVAVPAIVFLELSHGNGAHFPLVPVRAYASPTPFGAAVARRAGPLVAARIWSEPPPRYPSAVTSPMPEREQWVAGMRALFRSDTPALEHLVSVNSNLGARLQRHVLVFGPRDEHVPRWAETFGACFRVVANGTGGAEVLATDPALGLELQTAACQGRARLVAAIGVSTPQQALEQMSPERLVWEGGPTVERAEGSVTWLEDRPERLALSVQADRPSALFLADDFTVGWKALVDGTETTIRPMLVTGRGVEVPAGVHEVRFEYQTPRLAAGAASTAAGFALVAALSLLGRRRQT